MKREKVKVGLIDYSFVNSMSDKGRMTGEWLAHCLAILFRSLQVYLIELVLLYYYRIAI